MSPVPRMGCDVVDVERLSARLDRRPALLGRVFTDVEIADSRRGGVAPGSPTERARLAARFAAKEATRKALGDLRLGFHATEVRTHASGRPELFIDGTVADASLSLSHDAHIAMAVIAMAR